MTLAERIIKDTITDKAIIRKIHCLPISIPDSFIPREIKPVGYAKYMKKDNMPEQWSSDKDFTIGDVYPFYPDMDNDMCFPVGKDGRGKKPIKTCWGRIKWC